jgi:hypothetical protein
MTRRRSMETIKGVKPEELDNYNPEAFDAVKQPDGTYDLIPVRWMNQEEFFDYAYGCGDRDED